MIKAFADKTTAALFDDRPLRSVAKPLRRKARRKLLQIDAVDRVEELAVPPGNRLEKLGGGRAGQWSIRVDAQWRICFRFEVRIPVKVTADSADRDRALGRGALGRVH